tara:strand:- start:371 stop:568 length:198 start_codon:yes stop_codon:yes gene_type:complete
MIKRRALFIADFVGIVVTILLFTYLGYFMGRMLGNAEGYNECHSEVIFPTRSELMKLQTMIEQVN